ncbi:hypothetical protein [uncultured Duncaniella sp.]|uniref:hypothetical protein n=1 Tax=uncultured Duncaniella sp. TaxID=2768039 RepID=UPI00261D2A02|nr:hypothetical protein [uncultured Duncaniella sp.]
MWSLFAGWQLVGCESVMWSLCLMAAGKQRISGVVSFCRMAVGKLRISGMVSFCRMATGKLRRSDLMVAPHRARCNEARRAKLRRAKVWGNV